MTLEEYFKKLPDKYYINEEVLPRENIDDITDNTLCIVNKNGIVYFCYILKPIYQYEISFLTKEYSKLSLLIHNLDSYNDSTNIRTITVPTQKSLTPDEIFSLKLNGQIIPEKLIKEIGSDVRTALGHDMSGISRYRHCELVTDIMVNICKVLYRDNHYDILSRLVDNNIAWLINVIGITHDMYKLSDNSIHGMKASIYFTNKIVVPYKIDTDYDIVMLIQEALAFHSNKNTYLDNIFWKILVDADVISHLDISYLMYKCDISRSSFNKIYNKTIKDVKSYVPFFKITEEMKDRMIKKLLSDYRKLKIGTLNKEVIIWDTHLPK